MAALPPLTRLHAQHRRQPRRRRRLRRHVVARAAAGGLVHARRSRLAIALLVTPEPAADYGVPASVAPPPAAAAGAARGRGARRRRRSWRCRWCSCTPWRAARCGRPYYKITVGQTGGDTVVEVNNIFHQSMAPVAQKEYFYQWPYTVFGDTFENVLILGAGFGHRRRGRVDARRRSTWMRSKSIRSILRLGRQLHPDHPFDDPRVTRHQRRRPAFPADDDRRNTTWWCSR